MLQRLLAWDEATLLWVCRRQRPLVTRALRALTHLGDAHSLTFVGLLLLGVGSPVTQLLATRLLVAGGGAALVAQLVKRLSQRRRPTAGIAGFGALVANPDAFSFPSGHTAAVVATAVAWSGVTPGLDATMPVFAASVGFSRVYLGAHYPLDVMVGALVGLVCGALARLVA